MTHERFDASVVISTYNRPHALNLVLEGLSSQPIWPEKILVADDGSTIETSNVLDLWHNRGLPIEHVWHEDLGYRKTTIMNLAVEKVATTHCIFLDGDCIPLKQFLHDHMSYAQRGYLLAGPRILTSQRFTMQLEHQVERCTHASALFWLKKYFAGDINRLAPLIRLKDGAWRTAVPQRWQLVRGCNFSAETEHILSVGGFEESLFGWGPDDSDLAVRLINSGIKIKSLRFAAPVLHLWHPEEDRTNLRLNKQYLETAIREKRVNAIKGIHKPATKVSH